MAAAPCCKGRRRFVISPDEIGGFISHRAVDGAFHMRDHKLQRSKETSMTPTMKALAMVMLLLAATGLHAASAQKAGDLSIDKAWSRATPRGAKVAAGYLTITNNGNAPDRLVGGTSAAASRVEIHHMAMNDGVMTMRPATEGVAIEPGKTVTFGPGGYHLMFMEPKAQLKQGDKLSATLEFEKAGKVDVIFDVQSVGAQGPAQMKDDQKMQMAPDHKM
jgi:copper(I)-binding protein